MIEYQNTLDTYSILHVFIISVVNHSHHTWNNNISAQMIVTIKATTQQALFQIKKSRSKRIILDTMVHIID